MANYKRLTKIGVGSYGTVYKATLDEKLVAVKELHRTLLHKNIIDKFREECEILQRLNHKNVVRLIQFNISHSLSSPPALITELLDCDLEKYIKDHPKKIPFRRLSSIMLDVAEGLRYLHYDCSPAIIHRDLASKNILLTAKTRQAKIADFGLTKYFPRDSQRMYATAAPGTPVYAAPETCPTPSNPDTTTVEYNEKIDIFSFGVLLMETINWKFPECNPDFFDDGKRRIPEYIRRRGDIQQMGDHILKRLVLRCIEDEGDKRLDARDVVDWLQKAKTTSISKERVLEECGGPPSVKIVTLGESNAGKTCIIKRYVGNCYDKFPAVTLGFDSLSKMISVYGINFRLELWDTFGLEKHLLVPLYWRNLDGILLVFDLTDRSSLEESIPRMVQFIQSQYDMSDISIILVGNKVDAKDQRSITQEMAEEYAEKLGIPYFETSAKTGQNIKEIFEEITKLIYIKAALPQENVDDSSSIVLHGFHNEPTNRRCRPC